MKIIITGKHLEVGDSLRTHVEEATSKIVNRFFGDILEAHVNLSKINTSKDNFIFSTNLSFHINRHFIIRSHAEDQDAYRSFNLAMEKLEVRINRYRSRLRNRKRHHDLKADIDYIIAQQYVITGDSGENDEKETPLIIAEMDTEIPTASVSDAVMQMDLTEQPLVMFKNASSGRFNVVYRRSDGNIGWIDPEKAVH